MIARVYSVPGETEGGKKEGHFRVGSIDLSFKLFLTCRDNCNHYKSFHHLIPTLPVGIWNTQGILKQIRKCSGGMLSSGPK